MNLISTVKEEDSCPFCEGLLLYFVFHKDTDACGMVWKVEELELRLHADTRLQAIGANRRS